MKKLFLSIIFALFSQILMATHLPKILNTLESIQKKKQLDVIILNAPTVYYLGSSEHQGFEYDLISSYAKSINVELNLTVVSTVNEALELTRKGIGDITVASLTIDEEREAEFKYGPFIQSIKEQLICHNSLQKSKRMPKNLFDLHKVSIVIGEGTHYANTLEKMKHTIEGIDFNTSQDLSAEQLLQMVWKKDIDCTVVDSHVFMINQRYYPELVHAMDLSKEKNIGWILRDGDNSLTESLFRWLNKYERAGKLAELNGFYYEFLKIFDYYDTKVFYKRLKNTLPKYENYFKRAGKKHNIPWMILAAQSYQESHWKPNAKSQTGVRGMMMLTNATARLLKVKNRLSIKGSINGGAKYFNMMRKQFPKEVKGKNLWAFSLAAYNVGLGHVYDAQKLAKKLNKNPNSWKDLKTVLPLLSQKKYYKNLKYGYARGNEPVRYVDSIQRYYNIIAQSKRPKKPIQEQNNSKIIKL